MLVIKATVKPDSKYLLRIPSPEKGPVSAVIAWSGDALLSGVLFAPDYKTLCANQAGRSPLKLTAPMGTESLQGPFWDRETRSWRLELVNAGASSVEVSISVQAPPGAELIAINSESALPTGAALLAHALDRYVNKISPETNADETIKQALDKIPNSRVLIERFLTSWRNVPEVEKTKFVNSGVNELKLGPVVFGSNVVKNFGKLTSSESLQRRQPETSKPVMAGPFSERTYRIDFTGLICERATPKTNPFVVDNPYVVVSATDGHKTWTRSSQPNFARNDSVDSASLSVYGDKDLGPARDMAIITLLINQPYTVDSNFENFVTKPVDDSKREAIHAVVEAGRALALSLGIPIAVFASTVIEKFIQWSWYGHSFLGETARDLTGSHELLGVKTIAIAKHEFFGTAKAQPGTIKTLPFNLISPLYTSNDWWKGKGALYFATFQLRFDPPYAPTQRWSEWEFLGGEFKSAPAVSSRGENKLDVFVQGTNNHLMHRWWDGARWSGWEDLGGELSEAPCAVSWSENHIDCFIRGADKQLWRRCWDGNIWKPWELIGGEFNSAPTVASWGVNRLDVFVQGTNNHLMHRWWDGSRWSHWEDLGGELTDSPAAVSWGPNRIDCFIRGTDKKLQHRWWDGSRWSHWEPFEGEFKSAPAVSSWAPNRLDIFVQGTNNCLMHKWWDGLTWRGWENLGGELSEGPAAVSWGPNRIDCFVKATDNQLWHEWTWLD